LGFLSFCRFFCMFLESFIVFLDFCIFIDHFYFFRVSLMFFLCYIRSHFFGGFVVL